MILHHYSRKLCFAFIWISILCATGHCQQQFLTKTQGDTNTLVIILSVVGPIGTVGLYLCCCFIYYCVSRSKYNDERRHQYFASRHAQTYVVQSTTQQHTNNHQHRTLSHDTAFLHATNNSGGRQQTMVHSNSIRQTA